MSAQQDTLAAAVLAHLADALGLCITHAQVARTTQAIGKVAALRARTHAAYKDGRSY